MSRFQVGAELESRKCTFCSKSVVEIDAAWEGGLPYHEKCYKMHTANELRQLDKKVQRGTITEVEKRIYEDLQYKYDLSRKKGIEKKQSPKSKATWKEGVFTIPERRELGLKSNLDKHFALMEAKRTERWAWETFQVIENTLLELPAGDDLKALNSAEEFRREIQEIVLLRENNQCKHTGGLKKIRAPFLLEK